MSILSANINDQLQRRLDEVKRFYQQKSPSSKALSQTVITSNAEEQAESSGRGGNRSMKKSKTNAR